MNAAVETYLSDRQAAEMFNVSPSTIWRWTAAGIGFPAPIKLAGTTTRWRRSELEAWASAHAQEGAA